MVKIGFLLDSLTIKKWQYEIFKFIRAHPQIEVEVLLVRGEVPAFATNSSFIYRASQAFDRKFFSIKNDIFSNENMMKLAADIPVIRVFGIEKKFSYRFPEKDITTVQNLDLDLLIRFGFGILKGEILNAARYGIWSLHHGDNSVNRGGPPAFWEVVNNEKVTGITLQRLSEDLDGGKVIKKSYIKTDATSFYRNKNQAFWAGVELFKLGLAELANGDLEMSQEIETPGPGFYSHPLYKNPGNLLSLKIIIRFWTRRFKENFKGILNSPQWFLLYKFRENDQLEKNIFRYKKLYPPKGFDWADPFVVKKNNHFFVFFEELDLSRKNAHISYFEFDQKGRLLSEKPTKVLEESHHLSYPFLFENDGDNYLLPESADKGELWLYKAASFPKKWKKHHCIFASKTVYDASLYRHENYWYLFGTEKLSKGGSRDQYLHIYYSKDLLDPEWIPHPLNPVTLDVRGARPAGKLFSQNGLLFRPGQIGSPKYGYGIQIYQVDELSPEKYVERKIECILPMWESNLLATHTINNENGFTVMDAQKYIG